MATQYFSCNDEPINDPTAQQAFKFFCRHLVSFQGWYYPAAERATQKNLKFFGHPGFILSIGGRWSFVTAGHAMSDIDSNLKRERIRLRDPVLVDHFGPSAQSKTPIPLPYQESPRIVVNEDGLDFGMVLLSENCADLLQVNGVVPVTEENWVHQHKVAFGERHLLVGFPEEFHTNRFPGGVPHGGVSPTMVSVDALADVPADLPPTKFPRFIGRLRDPLPFKSAVGMSGGLILGFSETRDRYWVVAIQSTWIQERRLIFGCPVRVFASLFAEFVKASAGEATGETHAAQDDRD